jgi:hypothetical protein
MFFVIIQWCQTNFSSIEDIENCQNRGGFRQNIESIEELLWFSAPLKGAYLGLSLRGSWRSGSGKLSQKMKTFFKNLF